MPERASAAADRTLLRVALLRCPCRRIAPSAELPREVQKSDLAD
jgi:hypothetical protein